MTHGGAWLGAKAGGGRLTELGAGRGGGRPRDGSTPSGKSLHWEEEWWGKGGRGLAVHTGSGRAVLSLGFLYGFLVFVFVSAAHGEVRGEHCLEIFR